MRTVQIAAGARAIIDMNMNQIADRVVEIVSEATRVSLEEITGQKKFVSIVRARALIAHILSNMGFSYNEIGVSINSHRSNIYNLNRIFDNMYQTEKGFRLLADMVIQEIEKEITPSGLLPR